MDSCSEKLQAIADFSVAVRKRYPRPTRIVSDKECSQFLSDLGRAYWEEDSALSDLLRSKTDEELTPEELLTIRRRLQSARISLSVATMDMNRPLDKAVLEDETKKRMWRSLYREVIYFTPLILDHAERDIPQGSLHGPIADLLYEFEPDYLPILIEEGFKDYITRYMDAKLDELFSRFNPIGLILFGHHQCRPSSIFDIFSAMRGGWRYSCEPYPACYYEARSLVGIYNHSFPSDFERYASKSLGEPREIATSAWILSIAQCFWNSKLKGPTFSKEALSQHLDFISEAFRPTNLTRGETELLRGKWWLGSPPRSLCKYIESLPEERQAVLAGWVWFRQTVIFLKSNGVRVPKGLWNGRRTFFRALAA